jgi:Domain of unknown function (DUF4337)
MSEDGFHVHGPHDHAVEHAAHDADNFTSRIAVMTAIFATIGALFSYQGGATQNESLLYKNEAAIRKTDAANQWSYYQAKSNKQNLAELSAVVTSGETAGRYRQDIERYKKEKEEIKLEAEKFEAASQEADRKSETALHVHHRWAQAMTLIQISISLAAITLLTRKNWLKYGAYGTAAAGTVLAIVAAVGH